MKTIRNPLILTAVLMLVGLTACNVSLASDVTPPPDYQPPAQVQPAALETALPLVPPDPAQGQALYVEKCLPCHGAAGKGDGPQAANLPNQPALIGSAEVIRAYRPADLFSIVTQGNIQKFMPGFASSLNERQRWDVISYVYTLSLTPDELDQGKTVYQDQCAACHGETGKGDGVQAASMSGALHDWSEPAQLANVSDQEIHDVTSNGTPKGMPTYQGKLDDNQIWAVSAYIRSLTFATTPAHQLAAATQQPAAAATSPADGTPAVGAQPTEASVSGTAVAGPVKINGLVINASGGKIPSDTQVNLLGFDQMNQAVDLKVALQPDGTFLFENVPSVPDRVFMATVQYNGTTFNSDILKAADLASNQDAPLTVHVYDTSTDASALVADRMHVFFDFSKAGLVQVGELFIISNPTNRMITAAKAGTPVIKYELPQGATNLTFQDGELGGRYVKTDTGFGDTQGIQPGSGSLQVLFAYDIPYDKKLQVTLTPPIPVDAAIIIAPSGGVILKSSQLVDTGEKAMQGVNVHLFTANSLKAGQKLTIDLSGKPGSGGTTGLDQGTLTNLLIGLGALVVAIGVVTYWFLRRRREYVTVDGPVEDSPARDDSVEELLDAIVALDDQYQSGQISKEAYEQRRGGLKEKLRVARELNQPKGA